MATAKKEAKQVKAEERAIKSWLHYEKMDSEEDIKKKYGSDIFQDITFKREAAKYSKNLRNKLLAGFQQFINNRRAMLKLSKGAGTAGWKVFVTHMVQKTKPSSPPSLSLSSSSAEVEKPQEQQLEWQEKKCNYKIFQGNYDLCFF